MTPPSHHPSDDLDLSLSEPRGAALPPGLKAFVVSDVHLNNHPFTPEPDSPEDPTPDNPHRRNFRFFLEQLNEEIEKGDELVLILNGDIMDITGSWFDDTMPWDNDRDEVCLALCNLVREILENNHSSMEELRKVLAHPKSEIIYVFGNHDGMLQQFPEAQDVMRDFIVGDDKELGKRLRFVEHYICPELNLYVEHGHLLDPFNKRLLPNEPPLGDVINVLVVNRFVEVSLERMREQGYSEDFIKKMHNRLHDIEYLRPLSLVPVWIQTLAHQFHNHPESVGKPKPIDKILMDAIAEILSNPATMRFLVERLRLPKRFLTLIIRVTLRIPAILPVISFVTSKISSKGHSNKEQYRAAQRLYQEKGYRLIAFGHTHIPAVSPLSESAYHLNTGSWKPVINLFKHSKDPVELEYLNPEVQFNKVERSGILRIHKPDLNGAVPAEFSLQTIQSGLN